MDTYSRLNLKCSVLSSFDCAIEHVNAVKVLRHIDFKEPLKLRGVRRVDARACEVVRTRLNLPKRDVTLLECPEVGNDRVDGHKVGVSQVE